MSRTFNDENKKVGIKYIGHNNKSSEVDEILVVQNNVENEPNMKTCEYEGQHILSLLIWKVDALSK